MVALRTIIVLVPAFALVGCGRVPMPKGGPAPLVAAAESHYPVRTDYLAVAAPAATPPRLPSAGNPPLRSLQLGAKAFDSDFVAQLSPGLRARTIIDPQAALTATHRD